jgi:hypothetical protein
MEMVYLLELVSYFGWQQDWGSPFLFSCSIGEEKVLFLVCFN